MEGSPPHAVTSGEQEPLPMMHCSSFPHPRTFAQAFPLFAVYMGESSCHLLLG